MKRIFHCIGFVLLFFLGQYVAYAQLDVWNSPDSCEWFFTRRLTKLPPLIDDMPFDIRNYWIAVDSICQTVENDTFWNRLMTTTKDSLKITLRSLYTLMDYDPLLVMQYLYDLEYNHTPRKHTPYSMLSWAMGAYQKRFGRVNDVTKLMMGAGYIFHGRVVNKSWREYLDKSLTPPDWVNRYCADLILTDKIKGRKLYPSCDQIIPAQKNQSDTSRILSAHNCKRIYWCRPQLRSTTFPPDSVFYHKYGPDYLKIGQEYLIFGEDDALYSNRRDVQGWKPEVFIYSFIPPADDVTGQPIKRTDSTIIGPLEALNQKFGSSPLIFPIVNGMIQDPENFFGYGVEVPVLVFKKNLRDTIHNFIGL